LWDIENLTGSYHDDVLEGNVEVNTLKGLAGNDVLQGHEGADTIDGGNGIDTAIYGGSSSGVTILLNNLGKGVGSGGDAEGDTLISIENLRGSNHNDTFMGNDDANVFEGLAGNDKLKGFGGGNPRATRASGTGG
jgi:Ca2+-binding RTX toxin-like protein